MAKATPTQICRAIGTPWMPAQQIRDSPFSASHVCHSDKVYWVRRQRPYVQALYWVRSPCTSGTMSVVSCIKNAPWLADVSARPNRFSVAAMAFHTPAVGRET